MLVIRSGAYDALAGTAYESFVDRALTHLKECFPDECADVTSTNLRVFVKSAVVKGRAYGLLSEIDIVSFIDLLIAMGQRCEDSNLCIPGWAANILDRKEMSAGHRLSKIFETLMRSYGLQTPPED